MRNRCVVAAGAAAAGLLLARDAPAATLGAGEPIPVAAIGGNVRVALAPDTDVALVVWEALGEDGASDVLGARVRLSSRELLDVSPIEIATGPGSASQPAVAAGAASFAVAWQEDGDVLAATVDAASGVPGETYLVGAQRAADERPSIAPHADGWIVAWHSFEWDSPDAAIVARLLAADAGAAGDPVELEVTSAPFVGVDVAAGPDGHPLLGYLREASARLRVGLEGTTEVFGSAVRLVEIAAGASPTFAGAAWIEDDIDAPSEPWRLVMASTAAGSMVPATLLASTEPLSAVRLAGFDGAAFAVAAVSRAAGVELTAFDLASGEATVLLTGASDADTDAAGTTGALAFVRDGVFVAAMSATGDAPAPGSDAEAGSAGGCSVTGTETVPMGTAIFLGLATLLAIYVARSYRMA